MAFLRPIAFFLLLTASSSLLADEGLRGEESSTTETESRLESQGSEEDAARDVIFESLTVLGATESVGRLPGSAHTIDRVRLEQFRHDDVHRILSQIPGVFVQEEDGFGLRPNIGLRGTGVERSQKVTLLEDGILAAPAPYAAPSAYFSPTAGRMAGFEVRKGSASITQGPHTNGGVINYLSTRVPSATELRLDLSAGDHGIAKGHGSFGMSGERFGFLLETFQHTSSGFKELDGGGDTGFTLEDYLGKVRFSSDPSARVRHEVELTLGHSEQRGDETYLGLTAADFESTPFRRYLGSAEDRIDTDHDSVALRWAIVPSERFEVVTTVYRRDFFRDWYKNESTLGVSNRTILADPESHPGALAVLRGEVSSEDDALKLRHNRRDYYSRGIQSTATWELAGEKTLHRLQFGLRLHEDEEDRFQEEDGWAVRGGELVRTSLGAPGSQANRVAGAEALALFVQDEFSIGEITLTPGLRYESVSTERLDFGRSDPTRSGVDLARRENDFDILLPGLGFAWAAAPSWTVIAGVHRGFSPPSPSSTQEVDPEEALHFEAGVRFGAGEGDRGFTAFELIGYFSDYDNLLGTDTLSSGGGGTGDQFNGGEVDVYGLEASLHTTLHRSASVMIPLRLAYTFSRGEFRSSFDTGFADWSPRVESGDRLPYLPEHQLSAQLGVELDRLRVYLAATWVDETRIRAGAGPIPADERVEDHLVLDLSASYRLADRFRLVLDVRNLADEVYVAARRPYGLRPGLPRTTTAGLSMRF